MHAPGSQFNEWQLTFKQDYTILMAIRLANTPCSYRKIWFCGEVQIIPNETKNKGYFSKEFYTIKKN